MTQCQSPIFFPDDPKQKPQFSPCPREATTSRRTTRPGNKTKGEPAVVSYVIRLCAVCARQWDQNEVDARVEVVCER